MTSRSDFLVELDITIKYDFLRKESQVGTFQPFTNKRYNLHFDHWWVKPVEFNSYSGQVVEKIVRLLGTKDYKARFFYLESGHDILMHRDDQTKCAINFVLSPPSDPVTFEKYGDISYQAALLNTQERHGVFNSTEDRVILKISIFDLSYKDCRETLIKSNLIQTNENKG